MTEKNEIQQRSDNSTPSRKSEEPRHSTKPVHPHFVREVGERAVRKLRARRHESRTIWFGLGMMGLIGWSVVIPTLFGTMLGLWLDKHYPEGRSWTLALLVGGLCIGCFNAWHWVAKEHQAIREEQEENDE
ncbi:AtpZ/AtpI family protein [Desulforhopalus sp. IMCC35007]|uniref:AtpZ/AtpI family protein n=1 Tax=Desulforhopalus sp. IMCC35007 TaxID=2569543 RepID=UPI0010ADB54D|nr:AtpZ/AtpI family protein [Desulforhopalus sp. IMCC35007]TKB07001.1 F0F1 ATP synthase subunit [Desulforhopalus sp. IMCC35007]